MADSPSPTPAPTREQIALAIAQRINASTTGTHRINAIREALLLFPAVPPLVHLLAAPDYAESLPTTPVPPLSTCPSCALVSDAVPCPRCERNTLMERIALMLQGTKPDIDAGVRFVTDTSFGGK